MSDFDLVIRHGTVATAADTTVCDIGIKGWRHHDAWQRPRLRRAGDRRERASGLAGRHRQPLSHRAALLGRGRLRRRLLQCDGVGGIRRDDNSNSVRRAAPRPILARGRRGVPRRRRSEGRDRLRLPSDHLRPIRTGYGSGAPGADPRRIHLVQGLHDLRSTGARRWADARHPGGRAARGCPRYGACRKPRDNQMADQPLIGTRPRRTALSCGQSCPSRRGRGDEIAPWHCRNCSTYRSYWSTSRPERRSM